VFDHLKKRSADINYGTLALEIIVVMAGILIAFQIDRWGEERRERAQESRIGLDLNLQHLFDRLTAGILTTVELMELEEVVAYESLRDVSAARAFEITESYRRQALVIIEEIESLLDEIEN